MYKIKVTEWDNKGACLSDLTLENTFATKREAIDYVLAGKFQSEQPKRKLPDLFYHYGTNYRMRAVIVKEERS